MPELEKALQVVQANTIEDAVNELNRRMDTLEVWYRTSAKERLAQMEAGQKELDARLQQVESWIDSDMSRQIQLVLDGQKLILEKLEDMNAKAEWNRAVDESGATTYGALH